MWDTQSRWSALCGDINSIFSGKDSIDKTPIISGLRKLEKYPADMIMLYGGNERRIYYAFANTRMYYRLFSVQINSAERLLFGEGRKQYTHT